MVYVTLHNKCFTISEVPVCNLWPHQFKVFEEFTDLTALIIYYWNNLEEVSSNSPMIYLSTKKAAYLKNGCYS